MADQLTVAVENRDVIGKNVKRLRLQGLTPGVMYGHGVKPTAISIDSRTLQKIYQEAGTSRLLKLKQEGAARATNALIADISFDVLTNQIQHVDLQIVRMNEELTTTVPIEFIGESLAVKNLDGILIKSIDEIEVTCLPKDLPEEIVVDISQLDDFEKQITVADLNLPETVKTNLEMDELVAQVEEPVSQEELDSDLSAPVEDVDVDQAVETTEQDPDDSAAKEVREDDSAGSADR